jgi:hypothetical protein
MNEVELQHRIKNALIILAEKHPFKVGDLTFYSKDEKHISITGWTTKNSIESLTIGNVAEELEEIKKLFLKMVNISNELLNFIKNREVEYCLDFDYGMGSLEICTESKGEIKWHIQLNN